MDRKNQPMTTLRILGERPSREARHDRQARTVSQTVRVGWVWTQRVLLTLALLLFLAIGLLPRLGLYRPVTVLSGSMRPTFSPGDMVIVTPEPVSSVRVGQVISYQVPVGIRQVETHRVVRILQGGAHPTVQTQGDANNWPDPWTAKLEGKTAWRMRAVIPHLGYVVNWLRNPMLQKTAILIAPALLALLVLLELWGIGEDKCNRTAERDSRPVKRDRTTDGGSRTLGIGSVPLPPPATGASAESCLVPTSSIF
jgi:signal peptidase I